MNFAALLALFLRSVREETRLRSTYWTRGGLVLLVLLEIAVVHMQQGWVGAPGRALFGWILSLDAMFITLAGLSYFSSAITEEKEEMTLGLLRMTNLSPLAILLGKSTSRLLGALLLLIAQLPFTLLAVTMGGVASTQIFAAYAALGAYVFFLANVALLFSVIARRTAAAALLTGLAMIAFYSVPWVVSGMVWMAGWLGLANSSEPGLALALVLEKWQATSAFDRLGEIATGASSGEIWSWQVVSNLVLGLLAFALAWASFARFADYEDDAGPARRTGVRRAARWISASRGLSRAVLWLLPGRAWKSALLWKDFHFISAGWSGLFAKTAVCGAITFGSYKLHLHLGSSAPTPTELGWQMIGWIGSLLAFDLAFAASRIFRVERKERTLSSLAQLPISMRHLAWQKVWAALLSTLPQWLFLIAAAVLVVPETVRSMISFNASIGAGGARSFSQNYSWIVLGMTGVLISGVILFLHLTAWLSLRVKWGALPLAFAIWFVAMQMSMGIAFITFQNAAPFMLIVGQIAATIALHINIGVRLTQIAAED